MKNFQLKNLHQEILHSTITVLRNGNSFYAQVKSNKRYRELYLPRLLSVYFEFKETEKALGLSLIYSLPVSILI